MQREFFLKITRCILSSANYADETTSTPAPFVVEIDRHPHGRELQAHLGQVTGRRTVPNIMADGESIGGGDEMRSLEASGKLGATLLSKLAGKILVDGKSDPSV